MGPEYRRPSHVGFHVLPDDDLHDRGHGLGQRDAQLEEVSDHQEVGKRDPRWRSGIAEFQIETKRKNVLGLSLHIK